MLEPLLCIVSGHQVNRRRVHHPRGVPHATCLRCQAPVVRLTRGWVRAETLKDMPGEDPRRVPFKA